MYKAILSVPFVDDKRTIMTCENIKNKQSGKVSSTLCDKMIKTMIPKSNVELLELCYKCYDNISGNGLIDMGNRNGIKWNRNETILAYELYCRTPFSKISSTNPDIIALAELLGRTPGSVGLKMHNLAHFDPELQKRNVTAMAHGSKLDAEIFHEFETDWAGLSYLAQTIKAEMLHQEVADMLDLEDVSEMPAGEYRERMTKIRVGQYFFRLSVLNSYKNQCCITGANHKNLLIASHIKPWSACDERTERTNPSNGLCLNPFHDKAFDKGLITIDKNYHVVISKEIKDVKMDRKTRDWFMSYEKHQIDLPDKFYPGKEFIEYHNDVVFRG